MSRKPKGLPIDGVLLLDKGAGMSSNAAVQRAKRLLQAQKVGHTGSLDPIATGLLPLCLGEATKFSGFLLDTDKRYQVRVRLGRTTTTADIEGDVVDERPVPELTESLVESVLQGFRGEMKQVPPMYSALKHQGRRMYELARQGVEVERPPRDIRIHSLSLLAMGPDHLDLDVHCSKGTYIRSLAVDIGEALGCGGHVEILRRTAVGRFSIAQAITLEDLERLSETERLATVLPMDALVDELPDFVLTDESAFLVCRGQAVAVMGAPREGRVRLYDGNRQFLGIAAAEDGKLAPKRMVRLANPTLTDG